ncbi:cyclic nucleotide-binding domain-containing protein [bacterium]|nr:cyclic nucleotide-binding domain-containing protein [bacterium]
MEVSLLRTINIFEGLDDSELEKIFKLARIKLYQTGAMILEEGRLGGALHVIIKGKVKVTKRMEGKKDKLITTFGPQAIFGEMSLFDNLPYSANIIAMEETRCMVIQKESFDKMLKQDLELAYKILTQIITILSQRLRNTNEELVAITSWKDRIKKKQDSNS